MRRDIAVQAPDGRDMVVVEVKARSGMDRRWAIELHRNLQMHGFTEGVPYFLLITPDDAYLWTEGEPSDPTRSPVAAVSTKTLLDPDLLRSSSTDGQALELLVSAWISRIIATRTPTDIAANARPFVVDTGLFEALRGGAVLAEAA